jgi:hypothetical protein
MTITPETRKALKELGYERVLIELHKPMSDAFSSEGRLQAAEWIGEQERKQKGIILVIACLSLIAATFGAWPVVRGWLAAL